MRRKVAIDGHPNDVATGVFAPHVAWPLQRMRLARKLHSRVMCADTCTQKHRDVRYVLVSIPAHMNCTEAQPCSGTLVKSHPSTNTAML